MSDSEKQLFENLAIEHMDSLYSKAIRLGRSSEGAEDLVQQTYASAFCVFEQFDKNNNFNKWLNEILMRTYSLLSKKYSANFNTTII
jgi:RNA polymerase sigma-70 factor (ECF subfamily)